MCLGEVLPFYICPVRQEMKVEMSDSTSTYKVVIRGFSDAEREEVLKYPSDAPATLSQAFESAYAFAAIYDEAGRAVAWLAIDNAGRFRAEYVKSLNDLAENIEAVAFIRWEVLSNQHPLLATALMQLAETLAPRWAKILCSQVADDFGLLTEDFREKVKQSSPNAEGTTFYYWEI